MRLAEFISRHLEEILVEWEAFATTLLAPGQVMTSLALRDHATQVLTAIALVAGGQTFAELEQTSVWMSELRADEIDWYVGSGEPMDKAGGYAIQGLASRFIPRIQGSYTNVVGLPVATLHQLMRRAGLT